MPPALGPIIMVHLVGSATLAGLSTSIQSLSRFLVAYPIGWVADVWGRRAALFIGQALCLAGTLRTGLAVLNGSLADFVLGSLVFGLGLSQVSLTVLAGNLPRCHAASRKLSRGRAAGPTGRGSAPGGATGGTWWSCDGLICRAGWRSPTSPHDADAG